MQAVTLIGWLRGQCHPQSSTMVRTPPTGKGRGVFFVSCKLEPVSGTFLSPEEATWHWLIHSENVMCDLLTPLTFSFGNFLAWEVKSGNLCRFNIEAEHFESTRQRCETQLWHKLLAASFHPSVSDLRAKLFWSTEVHIKNGQMTSRINRVQSRDLILKHV